MIWFIIFLVGLTASFLGSLVGLGGAFIVVPALLFLGQDVNLIDGITPQVAAGTSLFTLIFTGLSSTIVFLKKKTVDVRSGMIFFIGILPGSILGTIANSFISVKSFNLFLGMWMILMSALLVLRNHLKPKEFTGQNKIIRTFIDQEGESHVYRYHVAMALAISLVVGFFSALFGIGGGALMVPAMLLLFRFPTHLAIGTSMLVILFSTMAGSVSHIYYGNVHWIYALALVPGSFVGAQLGAYLSMKLKGNTLVVILRLILVLMGLKMIVQALFM